MKAFDQARENLLPKIGASTYTISRDAIVDTAARRQHADRQSHPANAGRVVRFSRFQSRVSMSETNTPMSNTGSTAFVLPDGVSGLGPVLDTNFIGSLSLLTGTLPAQYGLRTAGVLDITSRSFRHAGRRCQPLWRQPRRRLRRASITAAASAIREYFVTRARQLERSRDRKSDA